VGVLKCKIKSTSPAEKCTIFSNQSHNVDTFLLDNALTIESLSIDLIWCYPGVRNIHGGVKVHRRICSSILAVPILNLGPISQSKGVLEMKMIDQM